RRLPASGRKPSRPATRSCASACRRPKPAPRCSGQIKAPQLCVSRRAPRTG
ncbi:unnamed protein product, partial [Effrenium voratum]